MLSSFLARPGSNIDSPLPSGLLSGLPKMSTKHTSSPDRLSISRALNRENSRSRTMSNLRTSMTGRKKGKTAYNRTIDFNNNDDLEVSFEKRQFL